MYCQHLVFLTFPCNLNNKKNPISIRTHEVKNLRAINKRTSQIMKWADVKYPNGNWYHVLQIE